MSLLARRKAQTNYIRISRDWRSCNHVGRVAVTKDNRPFHAGSRFLQLPELPGDGEKILQAFKDSLRILRSVGTVHNVRSIGQSFQINSQERLVSVQGYLGTRTDLSKKLAFASLKDVASEDHIQIVSAPADATHTAHRNLKSIRPYEPVVVKGFLRRKPLRKDRGAVDSIVSEQCQNHPEILLEEVTVLNSLHPDLVLKQGAEYGPEQRLLRLRTDATLRNALDVRAKIMHLCLQKLQSDSTYIETPLLYKSTSEGANEYLVPTRRKGLAYALPQSPQQFKQILMASGIHKYHQLTRCFRDEDLRADRQPEFTQLDLEMSFARGDHIRWSVESQIIRPIWETFLDTRLQQPFRAMTYNEAMSNYGSDKPDLRIPYRIHPAIQAFLSPDLVGKITSLTDPIVDAFVVPFEAQPDQVRNFVGRFLESNNASSYQDNPDGGPGIFIYDSSKPLQGLSAFGFETTQRIEQLFSGLEDGHLIVLQARKNAPLSGGSTELGNLRVALHRAAVDTRLLPSLPWRYFEPLWITDFPLFSPSVEDEPGQGGKAGFKSTHHPFTSPKTAADVDLLLNDPTKAIGDHYDLVINGEEIGGGSCRIHHSAMQEFVFRHVLKMDEEKVAEFSPLLEALKAACPPHAGIALGFDRLVAMVYSHMIGTKVSMRDVIAFPKSGSGDDLMMKSPARMSEDQLRRYHLMLRD